MDTVPAELLPTGEPGDDAASQRVEALRAADRMRIFLQGRWTAVQLLWRSDRGQFFLFAGEAAGRTHSITRRALERLRAADRRSSQRCCSARRRCARLAHVPSMDSGCAVDRLRGDDA